MKKFRIILLSILVLLSVTFAGFYIYYGKQDCQEFIEECYSRTVGEAGGRMVSLEDMMMSCPNNCIRYQEWNGYFKDKDKKKAYWSKKVKMCEEVVEKCLKEYELDEYLGKIKCPHCDDYGNILYNRF